MKQKLKVTGKLSVAQKSELALWRTLHKNKYHFSYIIMLLFVSNKPRF